MKMVRFRKGIHLHLRIEKGIIYNKSFKIDEITKEAQSMKRNFIVICTVMTIFLWGTLAVASDQGKANPPTGGKGACKADVEKFCKDVKPGGGRIIACLKGNKDRLSQACKDEIAKARENRKQQQPKSGEPEEE